MRVNEYFLFGLVICYKKKNKVEQKLKININLV